MVARRRGIWALSWRKRRPRSGTIFAEAGDERYGGSEPAGGATADEDEQQHADEGDADAYGQHEAGDAEDYGLDDEAPDDADDEQSAKLSAINMLGDGSGINGLGYALYDFEAKNQMELNITEGEELNVLYRQSKGWLVAEVRGLVGLVPEAYVQLGSLPGEGDNAEADVDDV